MTDAITIVEQCLGSPAKIRILTMLYSWKGSELTERQLASLCGLSTFGLRHALKDLEMSSVVSKKSVGRSNVWALNERSFHFNTLRSILETIAGMPSPIAALAEKLRKGLPVEKIDRIILFGSAAHGDLGKAGDVDIAILLGKISDPESLKEAVQEKVDEIAGELLPVIGKRIEPLVFSRKDWDKLKKQALGQAILEGQELYPHEVL